MELSISVSKDGMRCELYCIRSKPDEPPPDERAIAAAARAQGLAPIDPARMFDALELLHKRGELAGFELAAGSAPIPGKAGRIEWQFDVNDHALMPGRLDGHDRMNFRERQVYLRVAADALIARWHPPVLGRAGRDVYGRDVPVASPNENRIVPGKGVTLSADGAELRSTVAGHVFAHGHRVSVEQLHEIRGDVDYRGGNVHFPGNVLITGDVRPGFVVEADGEVAVGGVVDHADIRCGGDLVVRGGVLHAARLFVGGNVMAKFLLDAYVECEGSLMIHDSVIQTVVANCANFELSRQSGAKGIIGGRLHSRGDIVTHALGSERAIETHVQIGLGAVEEMERQKLITRVAEARSAIAHLETMMAQAPQASAAARVRTQRLVAVQKAALAEAEQKLHELAKVEAAVAGCVYVRGTAHEGVEIRIKEATLHVEGGMMQVVLHHDELTHGIHVEPIKGEQRRT